MSSPTISGHLLLVFFVLTWRVLAGEQEQITKVSPPDFRIEAAQKRVKAKPDSFQSYNDLAYALCRKARDTSDPKLYDGADDALQHSLRLSPGNYEARKLQTAVLLGRNDPAGALKLASELNGKVPDDIAGWALLVDANIGLGNYEEAERDAQWILDLRAGSALGFEKAAVLREMFGDTEGAMEFLDEANRRTSLNDADGRAWFLTQKARLQLKSGNNTQTEELLNEAFQFFPDSQLAKATLAALRTAQGRYADAALLWGQNYRAVQTPANLYRWAEALDKAGQKEQAAAAFRRFETDTRADINKQQGDKLDLVWFFLNRKNDPRAALQIAAQLTAERHDSPTLDAYAWALFQNGKPAEAKTQMDRALAFGVRDGQYFCHAAQIAAAAHDLSSLARFRKELAGFTPSACAGHLPETPVDEARR